jgi:hypothetical protein
MRKTPNGTTVDHFDFQTPMRRILLLAFLGLTSVVAAVGLRDLRYLERLARARPERWAHRTS